MPSHPTGLFGMFEGFECEFFTRNFIAAPRRSREFVPAKKVVWHVPYGDATINSHHDCHKMPRHSVLKI
jgi:hypothetical protein